jgi:hypothetical protein
MTDTDGSAQAPDSIEVGASLSSGTIRYWRAKEAVAKGELILGSQINALGRLMTSASSVLGWSVTISLALTAGIASAISSRSAGTASSNAPAIPQLGGLLWPALAAETLLLITAICCVCVLWPGRWRPPGHDPALVLNAAYETELQVLESMASGYAVAVTENSKGLGRLEKLLRSAWVCFVAAPVVGLIVYAMT